MMITEIVPLACVSSFLLLLQELRMHKNFSSLKAIISGLQSNPIYRLKKTWGAVIKDKVGIVGLQYSHIVNEMLKSVCRECVRLT